MLRPHHRSPLPLASLLPHLLDLHSPPRAPRHLLARNTLHTHLLQPLKTADCVLGADWEYDVYFPECADVGDE